VRNGEDGRGNELRVVGFWRNLVFVDAEAVSRRPAIRAVPSPQLVTWLCESPDNAVRFVLISAGGTPGRRF